MTFKYHQKNIYQIFMKVARTLLRYPDLLVRVYDTFLVHVYMEFSYYEVLFCILHHENQHPFTILYAGY